jgi:hypothetical protein
MRRALWFSLPVVVLVLLVLATRIPWTEHLVPLLLSRLGIHHVDLDLAALNTNQIHINRFSATVDQASGPITIRITDATCRYQLRELFQGRLDTCSAATVAITLPPALPDAQTTSTALPDLRWLFQRIPVLSLPVRQASIQRLLLYHTAESEKKTLALALTLTATEQESQFQLTSTEDRIDTQPPLAVSLTVTKGKLTGTVQLQLNALPQLLPVAGLSPALKGTAKAELQMDLQTEQRPFHLVLSATGMDHPQLTATDINLQLDGTISSAGTISFAPSSRLLLKNCKGLNIATSSVEANLAGHITIEPGLWQLQLAPADPWTVEDLHIGTLHFTPLQFGALNIKLRLNAQRLELTSTLAAPQGTGTLALDLTQQRTGEQKGKATFQTTGPLVMSENSNLLRLIQAPTLPVTLQQGALTLSALCSWSQTQKPELQTTIDFTDGRGLLFASPFSGLSIQQHLQLLPNIRSFKSGTIRLTRLQAPAPVENFLLQSDLTPAARGTIPLLHIKQAEAALFGGTIQLADCSYDHNRPQSTCTVRINDIDLPKIVALQNTKGLSVSGRVTGNLPIHFLPEGIRIAHGQLQNSSQGGIIRYQPAGGAAQSAGLSSYALKALEEFHYQRLAAQVQYLPNGSLIINLQLQGKSPNLDATRPVHLNINTEQNLLSLLKSLQYSHKLTSELDRQIQRGTHPSPAN